MWATYLDLPSNGLERSKLINGLEKTQWSWKKPSVLKQNGLDLMKSSVKPTVKSIMKFVVKSTMKSTNEISQISYEIT